MSKILLNLGCGDRLILAPPSPGSWVITNHDRTRHRPDVDVAWDLNRRPWPWGDNSVTLIQAWQVLEHLTLTLGESLDECWRILKPGGRLTVNLPLWRAEASHHDPTHRYWVTTRTLEFFDPDAELGSRFAHIYGHRPWRIIQQSRANEGSLVAELEPRK